MKSEEGISTHAIYDMVSDDCGYFQMTQIRVLVIRNLAKKTTDEDLIHCLSDYGMIISCYVCRNHKKSNHAFVILFTTAADAMRAMEDRNRKHIRLHNRNLRVMFAGSWYQFYNIKQKFYMGKKSNKKRKTASDLIIRNLDKKTTYKELTRCFSIYGHVKCCYVCRNYRQDSHAFVIFTKAADAMRAMKDGNRKRIRLHNRILRVKPVYSWYQFYNKHLKSYIMQKKSNKKKKIASEQYTQVCLENDIAKASIHMLNNDCLTHLFLFLPIVDRVRIERVCKRWRNLSKNSWYTTKRLDLLESTWGFSPLNIYTDTFHKILLKCGRFLTQMTLYESLKLRNNIWTVIGKLCPNLTDIDIPKLYISALNIQTLAHNCRNIRKLSFSVFDSDIGSSPSTCREIKKLDLKSSTFCDNELKNLFKLNENLRYLALNGDHMKGKTLLYLPKQMHTIILDKCFGIYDYFFPMALQRLENLKHLTINNFECIECTCGDLYCTIYCETVDIVKRTLEVLGKHCKSLTVLELGRFVSVQTTDMLHLTHLVNLQVLKVTYNSGISDEFLVNLVKRCQQLVSLDIRGCKNVSNNGLNAIAALPKLEKLIISYIYGITFTDHGLMNICNLKELECRGCLQFSDQDISMFIKSSSQLELLDLSGCENITESILKVAKDACNTRSNNVTLKIIVGGTRIEHHIIFNKDLYKVELSPLLQIVNVDKCYNWNKWLRLV